MTRISQADQILLLLRERLQRLERKAAGRPARADGSRPATPSPLARAQAMAALDTLSEEDARRTVVRALLTEGFGEAVANAPSFQAIVDDVHRILIDNPETRDLVDHVTRQLREGR